MEEWKDISGYEGLYQVSNLGRIKSFNYRNSGKEMVLKGMTLKYGYKSVMLCVKKKNKVCKVHRLVAETFIENPNRLPYVNHKDEDPTNNCVDNLEWCTHEYNMNYGTIKSRISEKTHRGKNPRAKRVMCDGIIYGCGRDCAEKYEVPYSTMRCWLNG